MTSGNGRTITWNDDNLPTSITSTSTVNGNNAVTGSSTFNYSSDMQRYQQATTDSIAGTSNTTYIGGLFEAVTTAGVTEYRHSIMASGGVVAIHTITSAGATNAYIHSDHLGSSDTITDDTGAVVQQASFDAFGLRRNPADWSYSLTAAQIAAPDSSHPTISNLKGITDRGFTAQEQLDSVGLVHMNGRVYDPSIGRFVSPDPNIPNVGFSQSYGRYTYVDNNPLRSIDPSGFDDCSTSSTSTAPKQADSAGGGSCDTPQIPPSPPVPPPSAQFVPPPPPPPIQTGSHIPGVTTGATCSGNCGFASNDPAVLAAKNTSSGGIGSNNLSSGGTDSLSYDLFPPKSGSLDLSGEFFFVAGSVSINEDGITLAGYFGPGFGADFNATVTATFLSNPQGLQGGFLVSGGDGYLGGSLLIASGQSGPTIQTSGGFNVGGAAMMVDVYTTKTISWQQIYFDTIGKLEDHIVPPL